MTKALGTARGLSRQLAAMKGRKKRDDEKDEVQGEDALDPEVGTATAAQAA
jgi:hypothetical protein